MLVFVCDFTLNAYFLKSNLYTGHTDCSFHYPLSEGDIQGQSKERDCLENFPRLHYILAAVSKDNPQISLASPNNPLTIDCP